MREFKKIFSSAYHDKRGLQAITYAEPIIPALFLSSNTVATNTYTMSKFQENRSWHMYSKQIKSDTRCGGKLLLHVSQMARPAKISLLLAGWSKCYTYHSIENEEANRMVLARL